MSTKNNIGTAILLINAVLLYSLNLNLSNILFFKTAKDQKL